MRAIAMYEVIRPFRATDRLLQPGELVDTRTWPAMRAGQLVDQRYLRPAPMAAVAPEPVPVRRRALTSPQD